MTPRRCYKSGLSSAINGKSDNDRRSRQQTVTPAGSEMRYEASFRPENGGLEVVFRLDAPQYHALSVGDRGMLSYKGTAFVAFTPDP